MDEQQQVATDASASKSPQSGTAGGRWGDPISEWRQAAFLRILDAWNAPDAEHGDRKGPFDGVKLTGADVSWLALRSGPGLVAEVPNLHLEGADLSGAKLDGARLSKAHLEGARLSLAELDGARLSGTHLEGADLHWARLERANLRGARLEGAALDAARLEGAALRGAHLEGADLHGARLEGANLKVCWLDSKCIFTGATFGPTTQLGDIHWNGVGAVDLTQIRGWEHMTTLGDEQGVGLLHTEGTHTFWIPDSLKVELAHAAVIRAYRQVATQLRAQGMNEVADRFLYRAQTCQRWAYLDSLLHNWSRPWHWPGDLARYFGSLFLAALAGYGYRPGRTFFWYVGTVLSFMGGYLLVTHGVPLFGLTEPAGTHPLHWYEALVLSVASFHGRGFFPQGISLGDPVAILAASEAVIGLFIEISFIATFTQRYFGGK